MRLAFRSALHTTLPLCTAQVAFRWASVQRLLRDALERLTRALEQTADQRAASPATMGAPPSGGGGSGGGPNTALPAPSSPQLLAALLEVPGPVLWGEKDATASKRTDEAAAASPTAAGGGALDGAEAAAEFGVGYVGYTGGCGHYGETL